METNFYDILSLESKNVGHEAIKKAYRSMALQYHPDVCPPSKREESSRMFIELQKAYETLSDPNMRAKYDDQLAVGSYGDEETKGMRRRQEMVGFSKEVWISQLHELKVRSDVRMSKKKQDCR